MNEFCAGMIINFICDKKRVKGNVKYGAPVNEKIFENYMNLINEMRLYAKEPFTIKYFDDQGDLISLGSSQAEFIVFSSMMAKYRERGNTISIILQAKEWQPNFLDRLIIDAAEQKPNSQVDEQIVEKAKSPPKSQVNEQIMEKAEPPARSQVDELWKIQLKATLKEEILSEIKEELLKVTQESKIGNHDDFTEIPAGESCILSSQGKASKHMLKELEREMGKTQKSKKRIEKELWKQQSLKGSLRGKRLSLVMSGLATKNTMTLWEGVEVGKSFSHFWKLKNDGTAIWANVHLEHNWSTPGLEPSVSIVNCSQLYPDNRCFVNVEFKAPEKLGTFISIWSLINGSDGERFGQYVSLSGYTKPKQTTSDVSDKYDCKDNLEDDKASLTFGKEESQPKLSSTGNGICCSKNYETCKKRVEACLASAEIAAEMAREAANIALKVSAAKATNVSEQSTEPTKSCGMPSAKATDVIEQPNEPLKSCGMPSAKATDVIEQPNEPPKSCGMPSAKATDAIEQPNEPAKSCGMPSAKATDVIEQPNEPPKSCGMPSASATNFLGGLHTHLPKSWAIPSANTSNIFGGLHTDLPKSWAIPSANASNIFGGLHTDLPKSWAIPSENASHVFGGKTTELPKMPIPLPNATNISGGQPTELPKSWAIPLTNASHVFGGQPTELPKSWAIPSANASHVFGEQPTELPKSWAIPLPNATNVSGRQPTELPKSWAIPLPNSTNFSGQPTELPGKQAKTQGKEEPLRDLYREYVGCSHPDISRYEDSGLFPNGCHTSNPELDSRFVDFHSHRPDIASSLFGSPMFGSSSYATSSSYSPIITPAPPSFAQNPQYMQSNVEDPYFYNKCDMLKHPWDSVGQLPSEQFNYIEPQNVETNDTPISTIPTVEVPVPDFATRQSMAGVPLARSEMTQTKTESVWPNPVEILPVSLVDGAINVAASLYSNACNALSSLHTQESAAEKVQEYDASFEYNIAVLEEMGFRNMERNVRLLKRFNNDINQVIAAICASPGGENLEID